MTIKVEFNTRLKKDNNFYNGLGKLLSAKSMSKNLKVQRHYTNRKLGLSGKQKKQDQRFSKEKL